MKKYFAFLLLLAGCTVTIPMHLPIPTPEPTQVKPQADTAWRTLEFIKLNSCCYDTSRSISDEMPGILQYDSTNWEYRQTNSNGKIMREWRRINDTINHNL